MMVAFYCAVFVILNTLREHSFKGMPLKCTFIPKFAAFIVQAAFPIESRPIVTSGTPIKRTGIFEHSAGIVLFAGRGEMICF
jgi:hypothetical protein